MHTALNRRRFLQLGSTAAAGSLLPWPLIASPASKPKAPGKAAASESIRLFSNENPYGPSPKVSEAIAAHLGRVNRYPTYHTYDTDALSARIAGEHGLEPAQVLLGHGSFELLCMLSRAFGARPGAMITPALTFNVVGPYADKLFEHDHQPVALTNTLQLDLEATQRAVTPATELVYLCNPNNPTGRSLSAKAVEDFCRVVASPRCTVAVDEAYIDLMPPEERPQLSKLIGEGVNVLVIRTFSKAYGLAGMRIGYALGLPATIEKIKQYHYGFGGLLNTLGVVAAMTALDDQDYIARYRQKNTELRQQVVSQLAAWQIETLPSHTNFVMLQVGDSGRFQQDMEQVGITPIPGGWPDYPGWVRVSIGAPAEMSLFLERLSELSWLVKG